jgi:hypothetical protein
VALTGLQAVGASADAAGHQTFTATLDRDGFTGPLTYRLAGAPDLTLTGTSGSAGTVTLTVGSTRRDAGTAPFTVTALPDGEQDTDLTDNTAAGTYTYFVTPPPPGNGAVSLSGKADGNSGQGKFVATVTGPVGAHLHLEVTYLPSDVTVGTLPISACTTTRPGLVTCDFIGPVAAADFSLAFVGRPKEREATATVDFDLTLDGYLDDAPADNRATVTLHRSLGR